MRDLINIITEASLAAGEIPANKKSTVINPATGDFFTRPELFLYKVQTQSPFTTKDGDRVVIAPTEVKRVQDWITSGPSGTISLATIDGDMVKNTQLQKTLEFGSKESETIKGKASDVFGSTDVEVQELDNQIDIILSAGGFPASEMYDKIIGSDQLAKLGKLGDAIADMANQIIQGEMPYVPDNLSKAEQKAVELYASEYLGVLALIQGIVPFKQGNQDQFNEFIGTDLANMIIYFPKNSNNPLADSFSIVNDNTGHALKISSKAAGKGAAPSLASMKLPDDIAQKYPAASEFLAMAQSPSYTTFQQPFMLLEVLPLDSVPQSLQQYIGSMEDIAAVAENSWRTGEPAPVEIMDEFNKALSSKVQQSDATDGGKMWYAATKAIMDAVNKNNAIPDLRSALIESLGYNFVQLYTNLKNNQLITEAFWPAKIKGQVKLKTKGSAVDPTKGKLSVEISPGPGEDPEIGDAADRDGDASDYDIDKLDTFTKKSSKLKASTRGVDKPKKLGTEKSLGRKRRD